MTSLNDLNFLAELDGIVKQRLTEASDESYTHRLAQAGDARVAQKVGEEALELALAATAGSRDEQLNEAADLVYHLLVLLRCKELSLADVIAELERRHKARD